MPFEFQKNNDTDINNSPITLREWAESALDAEELDQFLEAEKRNLELIKHYIDSGLMQQDTIKETVYVPAIGQNITVTVGLKTTLAPGVTVLDIPIDPEFGIWHTRYASDPNINYNPTIQL